MNGVKPFKQEGLEEAVLAAGTLVQQLGGPLCGVFEQVFSEHEGELPEVEKAAFEAGTALWARWTAKRCSSAPVRF